MLLSRSLDIIAGYYMYTKMSFTYYISNLFAFGYLVSD